MTSTRVLQTSLDATQRAQNRDTAFGTLGCVMEKETAPLEKMKRAV